MYIYMYISMYTHICTCIPRAPSVEVVLALGPEVYMHDLLWAIWSSRVWRLQEIEDLAHIPKV